jgi:hypothetical protein
MGIKSVIWILFMMLETEKSTQGNGETFENIQNKFEKFSK